MNFSNPRRKKKKKKKRKKEGRKRRRKRKKERKKEKAMSRKSTSLKRLMNEYKELSVNPPDGITAGPVSEANYFEWEALIQGPDETPYEGGIFSAELKFPSDYPLMPPKMKFTCPMFHPNIYDDGSVCISILHPPVCKLSHHINILNNILKT
jgi:ubiquitin-protein ligase